jgi:hypothetical protein
MAFCSLLPLVHSQVLDKPCLQKRHSLQAIWKEATTRSPSFRPITPEATVSTTPQNSCPENINIDYEGGVPRTQDIPNLYLHHYTVVEM